MNEALNISAIHTFCTLRYNLDNPTQSIFILAIYTAISFYLSTLFFSGVSRSSEYSQVCI